MDKISLTGLEIFAHHGVFDFEKENGQTFILDCICTLDTRPAGTTDNLAASLDYGALAKRLTALFQEKTSISSKPQQNTAPAHFCANIPSCVVSASP